jgi:hypothetical protein
MVRAVLATEYDLRRGIAEERHVKQLVNLVSSKRCNEPRSP